jgi:hypothetical protein
MFSANLWDVAIRAGFWKKKAGKLMNFLTTYGG